MHWIKYAAWAALCLVAAYAATWVLAFVVYLTALILTGGGGNR
jgi:hypothetical protein